MIRSELIRNVTQRNPTLGAKDVERLVAVIFETMSTQLADNGRIELRGFGAFSTRPRDARVGRNPRTGDSVPIDAKRVPYFKPGKEMRERLNVEA